MAWINSIHIIVFDIQFKYVTVLLKLTKAGKCDNGMILSLTPDVSLFVLLLFWLKIRFTAMRLGAY